MTKTLFGMSDKELWEMFPVILCEHQSCWTELYKDEEKILRNVLGKNLIARINHCGSTSIPGLVAKPIIDILLEINFGVSMSIITKIIENVGYMCVKCNDSNAVLLKGYAPSGIEQRVFHVHLRYENDCDELLFRDYLLEHPETTREYEQLKIAVGDKFRFDRTAYSESKTDFVQRVTELERLMTARR
ncbi:MAG: GrpB family protein [Holosporaceae bacterium]|nr:GrpB family protein [Holosporaceae bacterium]